MTSIFCFEYETTLSLSVAALRTKVFVQEQNVPEELEQDVLDASAYHLSLSVPACNSVNAKTDVIACLRLVDQHGTIILGRMAVDQRYRGDGIGKLLLELAICYAVENLQAHSMTLSAQNHAIAFYQKLGFIAHGNYYEDAGILHRSMSLLTPSLIMRRITAHRLAKLNRQHSASAPEPALALQTNTQELRCILPMQAGKDDFTWRWRRFSEAHGLLASIMLQSNRSIELFDPALCLEMYSCELLCDHLVGAFKEHRALVLRLLIRDASMLTDNKHALIRLARRVTSRITLRVIDERQDDSNDAFIVADKYMIGYRRDINKIGGFINFNRPGKANELRERFEELWRLSKSSREFSVLGL